MPLAGTQPKGIGTKMKALKKIQALTTAALLALAGNSGGCDAEEDVELAEELDQRPELDAEVIDEDVPELVDVFQMPEGSVIHSVVRDSEEEAIANFAEVLAVNGISGEFRVDGLEDDSWELVLVHAEPSEGDISDEIAVEDDGLTPRTTYYHDYYTTSGSGSYGTSVFARDDQGLGWSSASGKTSSMWGTASWSSSATFVSFIVTEVWKGTSLSGSIPWGLSGSIGSSQGTYQIAASGTYGNWTEVSWCVTGPYGWYFSSRTLTASLAVRKYGSTYLLSRTGKSYFQPDWTSSSDAC